MRTIVSMIVIVKLFACISLQAEPWNWVKQAGGVWADSGEAICTDNEGNVYSAGKFSGIAQFGDFFIQSSGGYDVYITKMDGAGNFLWVKTAGGTNDDEAKGITVGSDGNVVVTGAYLSNDSNFGQFQVSGGGLFITKLDTNGDFLWVSITAGNASAKGFAIDLDQNNNIYATGSFQEEVTFGDFTINGTVTNYGARDAAFITKLNSDGAFLWAKRIEEPEDGWLIARGYSIKADLEGNSYITGYYEGTAVFGSTTLNSYVGDSGSYNAFIAKLDTNGEFLWANHPTGKNPQTPTHMAWGNSIALDKNNNPYITGYYNGPARFNTMVLDSIAGFFVSKLSTDGQFQWALGQSSSFSDMPEGTWATSITVDNEDNCYIGGKWGDFAPGSITFGSQTFAKNHTNAEGFIAKINSNGTYGWAKSISTQEDVSRSITQALAVDNTGNLYATGLFLRTAYFDSFSLTSFESNDMPRTDIFMGRIGGYASAIQLFNDKEHTMLTNWPNPFNPSTTIRFNIKETQAVQLTVFNAKGEIVKNLVNGDLKAGNHAVNFDGSNLNSGIYFYRLQTRNQQIVNKMILCK